MTDQWLTDLLLSSVYFILNQTTKQTRLLFSTFGLDINGLLAVGQFNNVITLLIN